MRTLRMTAAAMLSLFALAACGDDGPSGPDPGIAACQAALDSYQSGDDSSQVPAAVIAGLKTSRNADLREVGDKFEEFNAFSDDEVLAHLDEILTMLGKLGTGCEAVGVPLPDEMVNPQG